MSAGTMIGMNTVTSTTAIVTGAGRGLGRALVDALLERGVAHVHGTARDPRTVRVDPRVTPHRLELTDPASVRALAEATRGTSLLINNAAAAALKPLLAATSGDVESEWRTNVLGTLELTRAVITAMPPGGAVVNVLSLLALAPVPAMAGYSASKAAAHSMTQALRSSLAERGIAVVGVYPGGIDTDMLRGVDAPKAAPRTIAEAILDGVLAGEEDVFPGSVAAEMSGIWRRDPKGYERELATW